MSGPVVAQTGSADEAAKPDRVQLTSGTVFWEIRVDGVFHSDYHRKEEAVTVVELIKLSL